MSEWDEKKEAVSVDLLMTWIREMREAYADYSNFRESMSESHALFRQKEDRVLHAFEASGLNNFNVPGLGTASKRVSYKVTVPKTIEEKRALFDYIESKYGAEFLDSFRTVNSNTLNKFFNEETQAAEESGQEVKIPGLQDPVEHVSINFRTE